ncbi:conserved within P. aerophilum [Pyrobaculum aerophilum str. IM2]|uniref:Conserved within P. aerophilum n=2 Tax=Pyrobaculum aerophilum TaxID=13773 RepID=Q8ZVR8_PYRAE|nr:MULTISPECIES: ATP-binding protein [Pyrobaculum]AAL63988.1 conserved within P. aerophilum [Pyrobaculum aerophilum str. IM2]HII47243.1 ATP-binding protein [Pyrobaculum aerophilum]
MKEIGIVVSGSTIGSIPVQIYRSAEPYAVEEQLVGVVDRENPGEIIVGFLRRVTKLEPVIRDRVRTPYVDKPEMVDYGILLPYTSAIVKPYVAIREGKLTEVTNVVTPGSKVYLLNASVLEKAFRGDYIHVGEHKYSGWPLPLDARYITHHVGVFGATGVGKSRLVRALVNELASKGYKIIVFDHTGVDYAPYYTTVIKSSEIKIPQNILASVIAKVAQLQWQTHGEYLEIATMTYEGKWSKEAFIAHIRRVMKRLNARDSTIEKVELYLKQLVRSEFFEELNNRVKTPEEILSLEPSPIIVDLSFDTDLSVKQAIIASVIEAAWSKVKREKAPANTVFVIDEAQNYAPQTWTISKDAVETTVREGRKWGLSIVLASQRIAGDIDPSIRANLGTVFFSRLTAPTDVREISTYLDLADVNESVLAQLQPREFFVAGLMNPLRKPVLIKTREVA